MNTASEQINPPPPPTREELDDECAQADAGHFIPLGRFNGTQEAIEVLKSNEQFQE